MSNTLSFSDTPAEIKPAKDRTEPVVWVRRLRLVEDLTASGRTIREVSFRRGLNIICTKKAMPAERQVVGHSVGKTLLLRLIRYCLGEHAYCTRAVRSAVASVLENAYVLAEVRVSGRPWSVARPIGLEARQPRSWAREGGELDDLRDGPDGGAKFTDFVAVLEEATTEPFSGVVLPHAGREANWLDLLAWLSRDQECRFRHQSEWRDPDSESRTARLEIEDASLVMRMAMDLLDDDEKKLQVTHRQLLAGKKQLALEIARLETFLEVEERELSQALQTDADIGGGELFGSKAADEAQEKQRQLRALLADQEASQKVTDLDSRRTELVAGEVVIQQKKTRTEGELQAERTLLEQLEEADSDTYFARLAELGERWCRLFQAEQEATAEGCPGRPAAALRPGEKDPQQAWHIEKCRRHAGSLEEQIGGLGDELKVKVAERDKAKQDYQEALHQHLETVGGIRQSIGRWKQIDERAKRYKECWRSLTRKKTDQEDLDKKIEQSNEKQRAARSQLEGKRAELSRYFDHVLKRLISPEAGGGIAIEARGIIPRLNQAVAASGQALSTSATVLGFDLACLIGYVCGVGHLPGLFLHDSPREADMEDALYHRLFHLAAEVEAAFASQEPSFQYIVATTTPPPDELNCEPYVRLRLDARREEKLLLNVRFTV